MSNALVGQDTPIIGGNAEDPFNGIDEGSTFMDKMREKRSYDDEMFEIAKLKR